MLIILGIIIHSKIKGFIFLPCIFNQITGLYCPGCGMTRAVLCFFKFDFIGCFRNNLLLVPFIMFVIYYSLILSINFIINKTIISITKVFPKWLIMMMLIVVMVYGVIRNFHYFNWLQPL